LFQTKDASQRSVNAVGEAGKTGWFYVLNRDDGSLMRISDPFVPQRDMFRLPSASRAPLAPSGSGGAVAPVAMRPAAHLIFIQAKQGLFKNRPATGEWLPAGATYESLSAVNVDSGKIVWRRTFASDSAPNRIEGPLSAADLVFIGEESDGAFDALDAKSGALLWRYQTAAGSDVETDVPHRSPAEFVRDVLEHFRQWFAHEPPPTSTGSHIHASPMAYVVDGREYIAIAADAYFRQGRSPGDTLYVFSIPR
jgi:alcohol dehydrogenase (cytochrome c)